MVEQRSKPAGQHPAISASVYEGITVTDSAGMPAQLAVIDSGGRVVAAGPEVAWATWSASIEAYRNHLRANGHLRALRNPEFVNERLLNFDLNSDP